MAVHSEQHPSGFVMTLGAKRRNRGDDPREDKYHFRTLSLAAAKVADLTQPRLLSRVGAADQSQPGGRDVRSPIKDQGQLGACAGFTAAEGAEACARLADPNAKPPVLSAGYVYEEARKKEGTFPADDGSFTADDCDVAIAGLPRDALEPYTGVAGTDYEPACAADAPNQRYVLSHHPFYPSDGNFLENIWLALDAGMPVALSMGWKQAFFSPSQGVLPAGRGADADVGGHAIVCWGIKPGHLLCANHWTAGWAADAPASGWDLRSGDFAIPWEYATGGTVWEARAMLPVVVLPEPDPNPTPDPTPPNPDPTPPTPAESCMNQALDAARLAFAEINAAIVANPGNAQVRGEYDGAVVVWNHLVGIADLAGGGATVPGAPPLTTQKQQE
jgi:hypothetical protein